MEQFPAVRPLGSRGEVLGMASQLYIVHEDSATAAGGNNLVAIEAKNAHQAEGTGMPPLVEATEGLGSVLDQGYAKISGYAQQSVDIRRMTESMHRYQGSELSAGILIAHESTAAIGYGIKIVAKRGRIESESLFLAVGKKRDRTAVGDGVCGGHEAQCGHKNLVARLYTGQLEGNMEGGRAINGRDNVIRSGHLRQPPFEFVDELTGRGHPAGIDAFLDVGRLVAAKQRLMQSQWALSRKDGFQGGKETCFRARPRDGFGGGGHMLYWSTLMAARFFGSENQAAVSAIPRLKPSRPP